MSNVFIRKLELFGALPERDKLFIEQVTKHVRRLPAGTYLIREGDSPRDVNLVMEGMAFRSKGLQQGQRQIFGLLVPGDFCDLNVFVLREMDHDIETLSPCEIVLIPRDQILEMMERPALARALWWATLVDEAILREALVNMGQRKAEVRIAHFFCEIHLRLQSVGVLTTGEALLPMTQEQLGEAMGLSTQHVNRSIQQLRAENLISFKSGSLAIPDGDALRMFAGFDPKYLHLTGGKHDAPRPTN